MTIAVARCNGIQRLVRSTCCSPPLRDPDFLRGPAAGPARCRVVVVGVRLGVCWRLNLDEVDDLEAVRAKEAHPVAVTELELNTVFGPFEAVHAELPSQEPLPGRTLVGRAEYCERRVAEENETTARAEEPRCLGNPPVGIAPDACPVLRDDEVRARVGKRHVLGVRLDERKLEAELLHAAPGGLELGRGEVDADRSGSALRQPGREVGRA